MQLQLSGRFYRFHLIDDDCPLNEECLLTWYWINDEDSRKPKEKRLQLTVFMVVHFCLTCTCVFMSESVLMHSVPSVREWMSMNGPQQGGWSSVGDKYADMTVMHGDVYSKWKDMGKSMETEGRWKEPMFIPSSVQQREIAQVYMNKWGQFIYHSLDSVVSVVCSVWYHQWNAVII